MEKVIKLECPGCGNLLAVEQKECDYCRGPIVISSFNEEYTVNVQKCAETASILLSENPDKQHLNKFLAMCFLKLKKYDRALTAFDNAMNYEPYNPDIYYNAAISLLKGNKAFLAYRTDIDKILENLNAAIEIKPRGIYYYFLAYIKYDFFERRGKNTTPNWVETLQIAIQSDLQPDDTTQLFKVLQVEIPECLKI